MEICIKLGNYAEFKNPVPKVYIPYDSVYIIFLKWENYRDREWISGC